MKSSGWREDRKVQSVAEIVDVAQLWLISKVECTLTRTRSGETGTSVSASAKVARRHCFVHTHVPY